MTVLLKLDFYSMPLILFEYINIVSPGFLQYYGEILLLYESRLETFLISGMLYFSYAMLLIYINKIKNSWGNMSGALLSQQQSLDIAALRGFVQLIVIPQQSRLNHSNLASESRCGKNSTAESQQNVYCHLQDCSFK